MSTGVQRYLPVILIAVSAVITATLAGLTFVIPRDAQSVFLHYNVYFGVDSIGTWWDLWWIPGTALVNTVIAAILAKLVKDEFVQRVALSVIVVVQLALVAALALLINAN